MAAKGKPGKTSGSSARAKRAGKSGKDTVRYRPDGELDFSDIPALTSAQLKGARRVGRPPQGGVAKQLIAIRIDPEVLARLRRLARQRKVGYQTLIQQVLAAAVA